MRRTREERVRATLIAAVAAAGLGLAPGAAGAQQAAPLASPLALDGAPFALAGGLAPSLSSFDAASGPTALATRVTDGVAPQVVVTPVSGVDGTRLGSDVVVSDAGSAPAGAAVAAAFQPAASGAGGGPPAERAAWLVAWVARDADGVRVVGRRIAEDGTLLGGPRTLSEARHVAIGEVALSIPQPQRRALVAWRGVLPGGDGRAQVTVQGWDPAAGRVAPFAERISAPAGEALGSLGVAFDARPGASRHLVVWRGRDAAAVGDPSEQEVLGRVLDAQGAPLGGVRRLSHVGADGDAFAWPVAAAVNGEGQGPAAATWAVAWSQWPSGDAAVRLLDADANGAPAQTVAPRAIGEAIERVAVAGLGSGLAFAYDVGGGLGPRRVELAPLGADGAPASPPLALSGGDDARLPLLARTRERCRQLALWRSGAGASTAFARVVRDPSCAAPPVRDPGPAQPAPVAPARPTAPRARRTWGPLRLRAARLRPRRIRVGRRATLRLRVTAPATVVVSLRRAQRRAGRRRLPRLRPAAATLRRVLVREPQTVVVRVGARDGRGRRLAPGRYRVVVRATAPDRRSVRTVHLPLRVAGR